MMLVHEMADLHSIQIQAKANSEERVVCAGWGSQLLQLAAELTGGGGEILARRPELGFSIKDGSRGSAQLGMG